MLVQTLVFSIILLLLLLKTEGDPAAALLFGFITYMFVYVLYLIRLLEQPFAKGHGSVDDVSFFLLDELEAQLSDRCNTPWDGRGSSPSSGAEGRSTRCPVGSAAL